ncbi:MAG: hypothetical protein WAO35_06530 [Terriglobia bacterium]
MDPAEVLSKVPHLRPLGLPRLTDFGGANDIGNHYHWLGTQRAGGTASLDAVGALVTWQAGDLKRSLFKVGGGGYLSS